MTAQKQCTPKSPYAILWMLCVIVLAERRSRTDRRYVPGKKKPNGPTPLQSGAILVYETNRHAIKRFFDRHQLEQRFFAV